MEWMISLALLPLLLCGAMCVGGAILALVGLRRAQQPSCHAPAPTAEHLKATDSLERV